MKASILALFFALLGVVVLLTIGHAQTLPGTSQDRVGYPDGYQDNYALLYILDRPDTRRMLVTYGNAQAVSVQRGQQGDYPYGSIIAQETWTVLMDDQGNPILDENGRFQKDQLTGSLVVMRKEPGFGTEYGNIRTGEWEYVAYRPDKSLATPPQNSGICANCHLQAGGGKDWVFRANLHFNTASGAVPDGVVKNYKYVPGNVTVNAGQPVTIYNDDVVAHTVTLDDRSIDSLQIKAGTSFSLRIDTPGEYSFHCTIHPNMKGKIVVQAAQ
jgi:plastocyanin